MKLPTGKQRAARVKAARRLKRAITAAHMANTVAEQEKAIQEGVAAALAYGKRTANLP